MKAAWLALSLLAGGCSGTVGPYVADIRELPDGRLEVVPCTSTITRTPGFGDSYETGDCTKKVVGRPVTP